MAESTGTTRTTDWDTTTFGGPLYPEPPTAATPISPSATTTNENPLVAPHLSSLGLAFILAVGISTIFLLTPWCVRRSRRRQREREEDFIVELIDLGHREAHQICQGEQGKQGQRGEQGEQREQSHPKGNGVPRGSLQGSHNEEIENT
ncbi:hypothetical protein CHU98_g11949 [Xylaria longipes]|nr:hypothetical protein CHU98_g11949 [Xylaria longipes]